MSLRYTAHSMWNSSYGQIGRASGQGGEKANRHFKFQVENCEVSVCPDLCVSKCVSPTLNNIAED